MWIYLHWWGCLRFLLFKILVVFIYVLKRLTGNWSFYSGFVYGRFKVKLSNFISRLGCIIEFLFDNGRSFQRRKRCVVVDYFLHFDYFTPDVRINLFCWNILKAKHRSGWKNPTKFTFMRWLIWNIASYKTCMT